MRASFRSILCNSAILLAVCRPLIARLFHTQYEADATSIQLTLDQTIEYFLTGGMMLECPRSSFIYRYDNGSLVRIG